MRGARGERIGGITANKRGGGGKQGWKGVSFASLLRSSRAVQRVFLRVIMVGGVCGLTCDSPTRYGFEFSSPMSPTK